MYILVFGSLDTKIYVYSLEIDDFPGTYKQKTINFKYQPYSIELNEILSQHREVYKTVTVAHAISLQQNACDSTFVKEISELNSPGVYTLW